MGRYVILTNARRAVIALVHTVVFLLIAMRGLGGAVRPLHVGSPVSAWVLFGVYLAVSSVLLLLTALSGALLERLYFAFCATSASFGLARSIVGDPRLHVAVYVRVAMLLCALAAGLAISRTCRLSPPAPTPATPAEEEA